MLMCPTSTDACMWALFLAWLLICRHEYLYAVLLQIKRHNCHSHVPQSSLCISSTCFSFQYQIAHLLSPKQRKHNLWLKIKHSYLFPSYYGVPWEKLLFCRLAGVFCSRFGDMSLFIVNFWCFIWYEVLLLTWTESLHLCVKDCLWSPDFRLA